MVYGSGLKTSEVKAFVSSNLTLSDLPELEHTADNGEVSVGHPRRIG